METPMTGHYASVLKSKWSAIATNVGILHWKMGVTPHSLTAGDEKGRVWLPGKHRTAKTVALMPKFHLVTLPTRKFDTEPINVDFLCQKLRELRMLCDDRIPWLKEGNVLLPQISDVDRPWSFWKPYVELWLPGDRYIVISGKEGVRT